MNKYSIIFLMVLAVLVISGSGVMADDPAGGVAQVVVVIEGSSFSPPVITIKAGTEVVWKNKDASPHTITADDGSFDSGSMSQGGEFRRRFMAPGTVSYSCDIHAYMSGKVEVIQ